METSQTQRVPTQKKVLSFAAVSGTLKSYIKSGRGVVVDTCGSDWGYPGWCAWGRGEGRVDSAALALQNGSHHLTCPLPALSVCRLAVPTVWTFWQPPKVATAAFHPSSPTSLLCV